MQFTKSEDYALLLIENLNHQVFMQFLVPVGLQHGKIELRAPDQQERMDRVVRSTLQLQCRVGQHLYNERSDRL
jgi:hypothetical protein